MDETYQCAVTGASGYVGSMILSGLQQRFPVIAMVRKPQTAHDLQWSLQSRDDLAPVLRQRNVKTLVHAAWDMHASARREIEETCVHGSIRLFDMALRAGVERIIFISTISAFEGCHSIYGRAKLAVERQLHALPVARLILRPGLVFGPSPGGVFGGIRRQVQRSRILPMIGLGRVPQYLLHEKTLADTFVRAVTGEFDRFQETPMTLAHPRPWPFRELIRNMAAAEGRKMIVLPLPPQILYVALRTGEWLGLHMPFRSDSVVSFVHYNANPDFSLLDRARIDPLPYDAYEPD